MSGGRLASWAGRLGPPAAALLLGLTMLGHSEISNQVGNLGSLVATFLPWSALCIPILLVAAVRCRSASGVVALLLPATVWLALFGGHLGDRSQPGGDLVVVSHNVGAGSHDTSGTARALIASGADLLALEELDLEAGSRYEQALMRAYPHHVVLGTVGLWSTRPLSDTRPVDVGMDAGPLAATIPASARRDSNRALRTTVATDRGPLVVYVAHLGSVRFTPLAGFSTAQRDRGALSLSQAIAAEADQRVVLLGDLNGSTDDRAYGALMAQLSSTQDVAGGGFGFSWPSALPVVRIDQILVRGVRPTRSWVLAATGSDHRPVAAALIW